MASSNRVQVALVRESVAGTTPTTPRMRKARMTGESLSFAPEFTDSDEIRDDRMKGDPILQMVASGGGINVEVSYPDDGSPFSEIIQSAFMNAWANTPTRFNDGAAASAITAVTGATGVVAVGATGGAFVANHLVRATGFGVAANNGIFKCTTSSATVPAFLGQSMADEPAPAAAARLKVVGIVGATGDITATAGGLACTALNFTDFPELAVGKWIKVGGTAAGDKFATAPNNTYARITAVAAKALTLDNLPATWGVDTGAGKTIKIWFGDQIKNGVTPFTMTIERGFLDQAIPVYIVNTGMQVNTMQFSMASRAKVTCQVTFTGMGGSEGTVPLDASPDAITTGAVMAGNANVARLAEAGAQLASPNWAKSFEFTINNNLRTNDAVDSTSPIGVKEGECDVRGKTDTYFGSDTLLQKFYGNTPTSANSRITKNGQTLIFQAPRITYNGGGTPNASGKNQDVMLPLDWGASQDTATSAQILLDRLEYVE
jgi:hypothetical protein